MLGVGASDSTEGEELICAKIKSIGLVSSRGACVAIASVEADGERLISSASTVAAESSDVLDSTEDWAISSTYTLTGIGESVTTEGAAATSAAGDSAGAASVGTDTLEIAGEKRDTSMNTCSELSELAKLRSSPYVGLIAVGMRMQGEGLALFVSSCEAVFFFRCLRMGRQVKKPFRNFLNRPMTIRILSFSLH